MKKYFQILIAALAVVIPISCKQIQTGPVTDDGSFALLSIDVEGVAAEVYTRGETPTDVLEHDGDKTANTIRLLIWDSNGNCYGSMTEPGTCRVSRGLVYTVGAVVNGPDLGEMPTRAAVESAEVLLGANPHVMYGVKSVDLTSASSANVSVNVSSLASRVHIRSIRNNMPSALGAIAFERAYLSNVKGKVHIDGTPSDTWYNQYGRKSLASTVVPGTTTGAVDGSSPTPACTYMAMSSTLAVGQAMPGSTMYFYTFPNSLTADIPQGTAGLAAWTPQATWLTLCGEVSGRICYWTVNIGARTPDGEGLAANCTYDVDLVVNNLGTDDPGTPVAPAVVEAGVSVNPWTDGGTVIESI